MHECETMTGVSTQEEADTLMIHHAVEVATNGMNVHIYPQDTDVLFFGSTKDTTSWQPFCGNHMHKRKTTQSLPTTYIWEALINWNALTGSDTTGHIHENWGKWLLCNIQEGKTPWPTR